MDPAIAKAFFVEKLIFQAQIEGAALSDAEMKNGTTAKERYQEAYQALKKDVH